VILGIESPVKIIFRFLDGSWTGPLLICCSFYDRESVGMMELRHLVQFSVLSSYISTLLFSLAFERMSNACSSPVYVDLRLRQCFRYCQNEYEGRFSSTMLDV
jgi:hypothetical protein